MNGRYALYGARIWDGIGDDLTAATLLVEGRKIKDVLKDCSIPQNYEPLDLSGKIIIPGLFDMHGHFFGRASAAMESQHEAYCPLFLAGGVTTVRTPGEFQPEVTLEWKRAIESEKRIGPRILTAGAYYDKYLPTVRWINGHCTIREFREQFERQRGKVDFSKVYCNMTAEFIRLIVELSHADGLKVYGHLGNCTAWDALDLGIDGLEHGFYTMSEFYGGPSPNVDLKALETFDPYGREADRVIEKILETNAAITPTMIAFLTEGEEFSSRIERAKIWRYFDSGLIEYQHKRREMSLMGDETGKRQACLEEKQRLFVARIVEAGGRVFAGTDPVYPMLLPGEAIVWEAECLCGCGMSCKEILRAMTSGAADEMQISDLTGSIEEGKEADLCILRENPLENISNLASVCAVVKGGRIFDSEELRNIAVGMLK